MHPADTKGIKKCPICGGRSSLTSVQKEGSLNKPVKATGNHNPSLESKVDKKEGTFILYESYPLSILCPDCSETDCSGANLETKDEIKFLRTSHPAKRTSALHSGPLSKYCHAVWAPRQTKPRCLLNSKGKLLVPRNSVLEILHAIYSISTGNQRCPNKWNVLHHDVGLYNILIRPSHYRVRNQEIGMKAKFIKQILDPNFSEIEEPRILIDFDNAADLEDKASELSLTCRTGTLMFASCSVSRGDYRTNVGLPTGRSGFPELEGKAKELYIAAHGLEHYDQYLNEVNSSPEVKDFDGSTPFKHEAWHDCESFLWVLMYELARAWPKGKEEELTAEASGFILALENHSFGDSENRLGYFLCSVGKWEKILHPDLAFLAPLIRTLFSYFSIEWSAWPELAEDHGHEAFKRLLLKAIVELREKNDSILLDVDKLRVHETHPDARSPTLQSQYLEPHTPHIDSKRSREEESQKIAKRSKHSSTSPTPASRMTTRSQSKASDTSLAS